MEYIEAINGIVTEGVGAWASVSGVIIAIVGFAITIRNIRRSKTAADLAKQAVAEVRSDLLLVDTVSEFSSAITTMEEIRRLHRENAWPVLPDRYSSLRKSLINIRATHHTMSDSQQTALQNALMHFQTIETQVEKMISVDNSKFNVAHINGIVSKQIDVLHELLIEIRLQIGK